MAEEQTVDLPIFFTAPEASSVELHFSDETYEPVSLEKQEDGRWAGVLRLPSGRYYYRFKVSHGKKYEWETDNDRSAAMFQGDEYNTLVVDQDDDLESDEEEEVKEEVKVVARSHHRKTSSLSFDPEKAKLVISDENAKTSSGEPLEKTSVQPPLSSRTQRKNQRHRQKDKERRAQQQERPETNLYVENMKLRMALQNLHSEWQQAFQMVHLQNEITRNQEKEQLRAGISRERDQWLNKIKSLNEEVKKLRAEKLTLANEADSAKSKVKVGSNTLKKQEQQFMQEVAQMSASTINLKAEREALEKEIKHHRGQAKALQVQLDQAVQDLEEFKKSIAEKESNTQLMIQQLQTQLNQAKSDLATAEQQLQTEKEQAQQQIMSLRQQSSQSNTEFSQQQQQLQQQFEQRIESLNKQISEKQQQITSLTQQIDQQQQTNQQQQQQISALSSKSSTLEQELQSLTQKLSSTQAESEQKNADVGEKLQEIASLSAKLAETKAQYESTAAALKSLEKAKEELQQNSQQQQQQLVASYEQKLAELKQDLEREKQQHAEREQRQLEKIRGLEQTIAEKEKAVAALQSDLQQNSKAQSSLKEEIASLNAQIQQKEQDKINLSAEIAKKDAVIKESQQKYEQLDQEHVQKYEALVKQKREKEEEIDSLRMKVGDALNKIITLEGDIERSKAEKQVAENALKREREAMAQERKELEESQSVINSQIKQLSAAVRELKSKQQEQQQEVNTAFQDFSSSFQNNQKFITDSVSTQAELLAVTQKKYKRELAQARKYFNMVQELRGNIRVFCRVRPLLPSDQKKGGVLAVTFPDSHDARTQLKIKDVKTGKENLFEFDLVLPCGTPQEDVFNETKFLVQSCMDGYNCCIFAYGQTGSGKTFTMEGDEQNRGINYRALEELFRLREERAPDITYDIFVSMKEVYNETIRDLLDDSGQEKDLKIRQGKDGMYVDGLTEMPVSNLEEVLKVFAKGNSNRSVGVTNMNEHSSRSHSLMSIRIHGKNHVAGISVMGKLHLVDLAGSERLAKSGATGQAMKEAQAINKSLAALGDVMEALSKKQAHIPYRNSKLTFLLQDSLGGHAKTLMFSNVSPSSDDVDETVCSLNFASRVKQVELGTATKNVAGLSSTPSSPSANDESKEAPEEPPSPSSPAPVKKVAAAPASAASSVLKKVTTPASAAKPGLSSSSTASKPAPVATKPGLSSPSAVKTAAAAKPTTAAKPAAAPLKK